VWLPFAIDRRLLAYVDSPRFIHLNLKSPMNGQAATIVGIAPQDFNGWHFCQSSAIPRKVKRGEGHSQDADTA
jgi:hypothetical protein